MPLVGEMKSQCSVLCPIQPHESKCVTQSVFKYKLRLCLSLLGQLLSVDFFSS